LFEQFVTIYYENGSESVGTRAAGG
jgi:hypothetical protein